MSEFLKPTICGAIKPDVVFINSPSRNYNTDPRLPHERELTPYGLAIVASDVSARLGSERVGLLDAEFFGLAHERIVDLIGDATEGNGYVGINSLTPSFVPGIQLAKELSDKLPGIQIVFGGPHATLDPGSILQLMPDSIVVRGDGVKAMAAIVEQKPLEQIPGLVFLKDGKLTKTGPANVVNDVGEFPRLNRSFLANEPYIKFGKPTCAVITTYGCRGNCAFCISPAQHEVMKDGGAKKVRFRDIGDVINESATLIEGGIKHIQLLDDEVFPNTRRAKDFVNEWNKRKLGDKATFSCLLRPDIIVRLAESGLLKELKEAGLIRISMGIETGYDRGRRMISGSPDGRIDSKYEPKNVIRAIKENYRLGIETKGFFMVGLPGETEKETLETINFHRSLKDLGLTDAAFFPLKIYPGTKFWIQALQMGFTPEQLGDYNAPSVSQLIKNGGDPTVVSRDIYSNSVQISELSPHELQGVCQQEMKLYE